MKINKCKRIQNILNIFGQTFIFLLVISGMSYSYETCGDGWACPAGTSDPGGYSGWHGYSGHVGADFHLPIDSPVLAIAKGTIVMYSSSVGYYGTACGGVGGAMLVQHEGVDSSGNTRTFYALYGHNYIESGLAVGDPVEKGQTIARTHRYVGKYDNETTCTHEWPHLHFGIRPDSIDPSRPYRGVGSSSDDFGWVDPLSFLDDYHPSSASLEVYDFWKRDPVYASNQSGQNNFDAQFKVRNNGSSSQTIDNMAIDIINQNNTRFAIWVKDSSTNLSAGASYSTGIHYEELWYSGNYSVEARLEINGVWDTYGKIDFQVVDQQTSFPDLVVVSPSVDDSTLSPGENFKIYATVRNNGGATSDSTTLRYYLSTNSIISTGDDEIGTDSVDSLSPGGSSPEDKSNRDAPSTPGTYWVGACVDWVNNESNTGNNCSSGVQIIVGGQTNTLSGKIRAGSTTGPIIAGATISIAGKTDVSDSSGNYSISDIPDGDHQLTVSKSGYVTYSNSFYINSDVNRDFYLEYIVSTSPDLVVISPSVDDSTLSPGENFQIFATVRNDGDATSDSTVLRYFLSNNSIISTGDDEIGTDTVDSLSPGGSSPEDKGNRDAPSTPGTYWIGACVDAVSGESDTGNNCSAGVQITVSNPVYPDLVVQSPSVSNSALTPGQNFIAYAIVKNQGTGVSTSTALHYYLSGDSVITSSDTKLSTDAVSGLSPGWYSQKDESLVAPTTSGTYWIGACVDAVSGESDTGNNCSSAVQITVSNPVYPDLVVQSPSVSDSVLTPGQGFTAYATVKNQGSGVSSGTTLRYYLSPDYTIDTGDDEIGTDTISGLSPDWYSSQNDSQVAPATPGTYWVGACVDAVSGESNTGNNCSSGVLITVSDPTPAPPANVNASDGTYINYVYITWNSVSGAPYYRVYRNTVHSTSGATALTIWLNGNSFWDISATPGQTYYYWVKAATSGSGTNSSDYSSYNIGYPGLSAPLNVSATDGAYTDRVVISWSDVTGAGYYRVYRNSVNNSGTAIAIGGASGTSFPDYNALPGQIYNYWVKAESSNAGVNDSAFSTYNTGYRGLAVPTGVSASDGTYTDKVYITWSSVTGASFYRVYRNTTNNSSSATALSAWQSDNSYSDTGSTPGQTYYYWVKAATSSTGANTSGFSTYNTGSRTVAKSEITNPTPGSTLASTTETFTWTHTGAVQYWLRIGTSVGESDLYDASQGTDTSRVVIGLPSDGSNVYVRLFSYVSGAWVYNDYIYNAYSYKCIGNFKISPSDGAENDIFGYAVSISGDYAIVGSPQDDVNESNSGSAYIFYRSGTEWIQQAKLTASDGGNNNWFGNSVAISGDTAIVGAYGVNDNFTNSGAAYVFVKPVGGWSDMDQTAKLTVSAPGAYDYFGYSVAISGDTAIVGAYGDDNGGYLSGAAYMFVKPVDGWSGSLNETAKLTASDAAADDWFGYSVAISGDTAIVGAYGNSDSGNYTGSAYVFVKPGGGWSGALNETVKLTASDAAANTGFGWAVAISGDTAIIGAPVDNDGDTNSGAAYVFLKPEGGWGDALNETAKLTTCDATYTNNVGMSVATNGDAVIVGAYGEDDGILSGSAYMFVQPASGWGDIPQSLRLTVVDATANDYFRLSVAISDDTYIIGMGLNDDGGADSGSAYVFCLNDTGAAIIKGDLNGDKVVDLTDAIIALQVITGYAPAQLRTDYAISGADVNGDNQVGPEELIYILQKEAELR